MAPFGPAFAAGAATAGPAGQPLLRGSPPAAGSLATVRGSPAAPALAPGTAGATSRPRSRPSAWGCIEGYAAPLASGLAAGLLASGVRRRSHSVACAAVRGGAEKGSRGIDAPVRATLVALSALALVVGLAGGPAYAEEASDMLPLEGISWESFVNLNCNFIIAIDNLVGSAGASIIVFTLLTKIALFPINQPALKTNAVTRLLTPQMNQIQEMYQNDDETKKKLIGALYAKTGINPVGGLLPIFAQLPIFVGLYTAIKKLATVDSHFKEPFLWIPSLAGPTDGGLDWLLTSKVENGFEPSVGWQNAGLYFLLPVVLLTVQLSLAKLTTPNKEPDAVTLAFPFIVATSTLVTPQGLGVYWLTNSVLSAAQTQLARSEIDAAYPELKRVWEASDDKPEPVMKGDKVTLNGRVGVVVYGPDVDDDCRVQYEDDGTESNFVKSFRLRKAGTVMDEAISDLQAAVIPEARPKSSSPLRKQEPQTRAAKRAAKKGKKQRAR